LWLDDVGAGAPALAAAASAAARARALPALSEDAKASRSMMSPATSSAKRADIVIEAIHRTTGSGP
jgi:hypothetical protein